MAVSSKTVPAYKRDCSSAEAVASSIQLTLNHRANTKRGRQPDPTAFLPFVLSAGGVLLDDTDKALAEWRRYICPSEMGFMLDRIACALLNRRLARFFTCSSSDIIDE